ncbi:MAG: hypothetical protein J5595_11420 [Bacteroidales bacterium]|nr:hypothetical protein [Bacteroidales bacterium]
MENTSEEKETQQQNQKLSKTKCQELINQVENKIRYFAYEYPDSVTAVVLNGRLVYLLTLVAASIALMVIQPCIANGILIFCVCVGALACTQDWPVGDTFSRYSFEYTLSKCQKMLRPYADFPDVKKYYDSIEPNLKKLQSKKKLYRVLGVLIMIMFFIVVGGYLWYVWMKT